jgi:hypothetical protein
MSPERPTPGLGLLAPDIDMQAACVAACVRASTVCSVTADACLDEDGVADLRAADACDALLEATVSARPARRRR